MKTIIYSFIAIFFFGMIATGFTNKANAQNSILIQSVDRNASTAALSASAKIITNRLKDFSSQEFKVTIIQENRQILVTLFDEWDLKTVENLLVHKGRFAFYETYNRKSLSDLLNGSEQLFSLLNSDNSNDSSAEIGCAPAESLGKIDDYLSTLQLEQKCIFVWGQNSDHSQKCLYALRTVREKGALIVGNEIESVKTNQNKTSGYNEITIALKKQVVELWAKATKRNMNQAIAIVLDNTVLSAPVIRSEINEGHCTITGNFTQNEARYFAALGNNGELPLVFELVK
jgi:preprotein translocase subunit SecD